MRVDFAFGRTGLIVDLPTGFRYQILEARSARPLADAVAAVEAALDSPIGASPLEELARGNAPRTPGLHVELQRSGHFRKW